MLQLWPTRPRPVYFLTCVADSYLDRLHCVSGLPRGRHTMGDKTREHLIKALNNPIHFSRCRIHCFAISTLQYSDVSLWSKRHKSHENIAYDLVGTHNMCRCLWISLTCLFRWIFLSTRELEAYYQIRMSSSNSFSLSTTIWDYIRSHLFYVRKTTST